MTAISGRNSSNNQPLKICIRLTEELKFHLFELSCAECKVSRRDLIAERFSDLCNTKRQLLPGSTLYILKVYEIPCAVSGLK